MKRIKLSQGLFSLVDDADYEWLNQWKWCVQKNGRKYYAIRSVYEKSIKVATLRMHRVILDIPENLEGDHRNHNGLDNQRNNLRICTHQQNMQNQRENQNTSSEFKGVVLNKRIRSGKIWRAQIRFNNKIYHLGSYYTEEEAATVYNKKATELFGEYACLNYISPRRAAYELAKIWHEPKPLI